MKKAKLFISFLILLFFIKVYSQDSCSILYSLNQVSLDTNRLLSEETFHVNYNTYHFSYKYNNNFYLNGKKITNFRNVNYIDEVAVVVINNIIYFYAYPIYNGQGGPYVWTLGNGILIIIEKGKQIKKLKNVDYLDDYGYCRDIDKYLKKIKNKKQSNKKE